MSDEEHIASIARWYELPVEQVALLWSAFRWVSGTGIQQVIRASVVEFIRAKMV